MKVCIICGEKAAYSIKNSSETYCADCAREHFSDISYLQKIESDARILHKIVKEKIKK
jgi:hypothetical protein